MTTIYFVRHCKPDSSWQDNRTRPLTQEGVEDSFEVARILKDKKIDLFISSPYKRSFDSIKPAAELYKKEIQTDERLRERKAGPNGNNHEMFQKRWADFSYAEPDGVIPLTQVPLRVRVHLTMAKPSLLLQHLLMAIILSTGQKTMLRCQRNSHIRSWLRPTGTWWLISVC